MTLKHSIEMRRIKSKLTQIKNIYLTEHLNLRPLAVKTAVIPARPRWLLHIFLFSDFANFKQKSSEFFE